MAYKDEYYRAYKDFCSAVAAIPFVKAHREASKNADSGIDSFKGSERYCEIDMTWVEAIERAIPYIDSAIRQNRRFIAVEEDVVPIEKSKKITTESVRHLAQHTNMIARVEGDRVTPETILNIRREESYAIYENRFLVLLLNTALYFIENRFNVIKINTNSAVSYLKLDRAFDNEDGKTDYKLEFYSEYEENGELDINADVSTLTDYERILRIRAILFEFAAQPLIRELRNVEPIHPPITRTNMLLKDPAFRECLELWTFFETYTEDGYRVVQTPESEEMPSLLQRNVEGAMDVVNFVVQNMGTEDHVNALEKYYEQESIKRAQAAAKEEERRQKKEAAKIAAAVAAEKALQQERLDALRNELEEKMQAQRTEFENKLSEQKEYFEGEIKSQKDEYENKLSEQKEKSERELKSQKDEYENKLSEQKESFTNELRARESRYELDLSTQKERYERQLAELESNCENRIGSLTADYENKLSSMSAGYESRICSIVSDYEGKLSNMSAGYEKRIRSISSDSEKLVNDTNRSCDERVRRIEQESSDRISKLTREYENKLSRQLEKAEKAAANYKKTLENINAKHAAQLDKLTKSCNARLEKQERKYGRKIRLLSRRLEKALTKCPQSEVMAIESADTEE